MVGRLRHALAGPWRLALAGTLLAAAAVPAALAGGRLGIVGGIVTVLVAASPAILRLRQAPFDAPGLVAAFTVATFGLTALSWLWTPPNPGPGLDRDEVASALLVVASALAAFSLGAALLPHRLAAAHKTATHRPGHGLPPPAVLASAYAVTLVAVLSGLALGAYGYAADAGAVAALGPGASALGIVGSLSAVVILATALCWTGGGSCAHGRLLALLLAVQVPVGFAAGLKGETLTPVLLVGFAYALHRGRVPWRAVGGVIALTAMVLIPANNIYRLALRGAGESLPAALLRAVTDVDAYRPDRTVGAAGQFVLLRFRQIDNVALIVADTPSLYAFGDGRPYAELPLIVLVPRPLWPDKPTLNAAEQFSHTYWGIPQTIRTSTPVTQIGDLYRNFGAPGVTIGMLVCGLALAALARLWRRWRSLRSDAVYGFLLVTLVLGVESDLPLLVATLSRTLPLVVFLAWLLLPGRSGPAGYRLIAERLPHFGRRTPLALPAKDRPREATIGAVKRTGVAASSLAVAAIFGGCSETERPERITRTAPPELTQRLDGALTRPPAPLHARDIAEAGASTAAGAVLQLWFAEQWGGAPFARTFYDPQVAKAVGKERLAGALAAQRENALSIRPRVREVRPTSVGILVLVDLLTATQPPMRESFVLRRSDDRWRVLHDSFLERAVAAYVPPLNGVAFAPGVDPPARVRLAARRAAARLRALIPRELGVGAQAEK